MRAVFVGASSITVMAVKEMTEAGHEVVVIDTSKEKIEELEEELDCGFVNADGSRPSVLRELGADDTDVLFCLSDDDQDNIIASLVGKSLGFERVITKIEDPDFESICVELGLDNPIIPSRETANKLVDMLEGRELSGLATVMKCGLRFISFVATSDEEGTVSDLKLPEKAKVLAVVRDDKSEIAGSDVQIRKGDEVALIAAKDQVDKLRERFSS